MASKKGDSRRMILNEQLTHYIPPRDTWNPADESLYQPVDLYRVPLDEAQDMQLKAIKFTFTHHYRNNDFYHTYCEMRNIRPDDIKTTDDLDTIPLIPDTTFKQYPSGKDFAHWLANVFTGDLPKIVIEGANPTFDDVINAFNAAGLAVSYSSGTSGRHTVIPRDMKTFRAAEYAAIKLRGSMLDQTADHVLMLTPNSTKTNLFMGKITSFIDDLYPDVHYAVDYEITTGMTQRAMSESPESKGKGTSYVQSEMQQSIVDNAIQWLERYNKTDQSIRLSGPPFMFFHIMNTLLKDGKSFDFGERGKIGTGGGWKIYEDKRMPQADFRKQVEDTLGIPGTHCLDAYGMVEGNGWMMQCPEGHYFHIPHTYYKPLVLDDDFTPMGYGEWGRFAFLDATAQSYPGFIISGDRVRLLERCPVCDRPGPVLEPEIQRASGEEVRGCAEELRRILAQALQGDINDATW
jgi:long-chain-fatty-acid---luciferin-component ligase